MVRGELDGAHGAFSVDEHRALNPLRRRTAGGLGRRGDAFPDFDGAVKGGGGEDDAEFGMRPGDLHDSCVVCLQLVSAVFSMVWECQDGIITQQRDMKATRRRRTKAQLVHATSANWAE